MAYNPKIVSTTIQHNFGDSNLVKHQLSNGGIRLEYEPIEHKTPKTDYFDASQNKYEGPLNVYGFNSQSTIPLHVDTSRPMLNPQNFVSDAHFGFGFGASFQSPVSSYSKPSSSLNAFKKFGYASGCGPVYYDSETGQLHR